MAVSALLEHHAALEEVDPGIEHRQLCVDVVSQGIVIVHPWVASVDRYNTGLMSQNFKLKAYRKALGTLLLDSYAVDNKLRKLGKSQTDEVVLGSSLASQLVFH